MCGIVGLLSSRGNIIPDIMSALNRLQNRGYDSLGICVLGNQQLRIAKHASTTDAQAFEKLEQSARGIPAGSIGMGHTRWATHGAKTDANSHPHVSNDGAFALVHNGIIQNHGGLRSVLAAEGIECISDTDSEVVVQLLSLNYQKRQTDSEEDRVAAAIEDTLAQLEGTWALVIASTHAPDALYCTCSGNPLVIGEADDGHMACVVSEPAGFPKGVTRCFALGPNDVAVFKRPTPDKVIVHTHETYIPHVFDRDVVHTLGDMPHWTLKEIMEQPQTVRAVLNFGARLEGHEVRLGGLEAQRKNLEALDHLIVLGCGTSLHAGEMGACYLRQLCDFITVQTVDAAEFAVDRLPRSNNSNKGGVRVGAVLLSQSGETADLQRCMPTLKAHGVLTIGIVNVRDSLVARAVDCGVYLNAGREVGVASTKSFVAQCAAMAMLAMWFGRAHRPIDAEARAAVAADMRQLSTDVEHVLDRLQPRIQQLAPCLIATSTALYWVAAKEK